MLRTKISKNRFKKTKQDTYFDRQDSEANQDEELYYKVSRTLTDGYKRPSQHDRIIKEITQKVHRPTTATSVKKDYIQLQNLLNHRQKISQSQQKNINRLRTIKSISKSKEKDQEFYSPLNKQIKKSECNLRRKKYEKYSASKLQIYYQSKVEKNKKQNKENQNKRSKPSLFMTPKKQVQENNLIQAIFSKSIQDIRNHITNSSTFKEKLNVFGQQYLQKNRDSLIEEAKKLIRSINREDHASYQFQKYSLNHFLLRKLMLEIFNDTKLLEIKNTNIEIYKRIKDEMVGQLTSQETFFSILSTLNEYQTDKQGEGKQGKAKTGRRKIPRRKQNRLKTFQNYLFTSPGKHRQSDIVSQFDEIFKLTNQKLQQAQKNLKIPKKKNNNFLSMVAAAAETHSSTSTCN